jgi:hypothetical protein
VTWLIDEGDGNHKWGAVFLTRKLPIPNATMLAIETDVDTLVREHRLVYACSCHP